MNFIVYQPTSERQIANLLGEPEYSYYFVMRDFRRVLESMGTVHEVESPERDVDPLYDDLAARGEDVLFFCFAPPHRCPVDLRCPTTSVFAWEFGTLPDEVWGADPRTDWRYVFRKHGRAISLSRMAADLVKQAMGEDFPVAAIPVPVWDRLGAARAGTTPANPICGGVEIEINGVVLDDRKLCNSDAPLSGLPARPWTGDPIHLEFRAGERGWALLNGFYGCEYWGTWSRVAQPSITLPCAVSGHIRMTLDACAFGPNVGRPITVRVGDSVATVELGQVTGRHELEFRVTTPTYLVHFSNLDLTPVPHVRDPRSMGIGLTSVRIERAGAEPALSGGAVSAPRPERARVSLDGVVYTSVLNPLDGRKNWKDLVSAFVWSFREVSDATLVLKMTHHDIFVYLNELRAHLMELVPYECRIVVLHGFLDDDAYVKLIGATTYYANASGGEGLCLPLMEFMSCGRPAIAAANTAMLDYTNAENAFPVGGWRVHNPWPHDPRQQYRTTRYRIDWESLWRAYRESYAIAKSDPGRYGRMSLAALSTLEAFCSDRVIAARLHEFLTQPVAAR